MTVDVILDARDGPRRQPGGGAFYSALQAARLGLRARVVSAGVARELEPLLEPYRDELDFEIEQAPATTTLATRGSGVDRRQRLLAWAGLVAAPSIPAGAEVLHLAPVARELDGAWVAQELDGDSTWAAGQLGGAGGASARLVGLTPQGLLRTWDEAGGELRAAAGRELRAVAGGDVALPRRLDAVVLAEAERERFEPLLARRAGLRPVLAITAGPRPTTLRLRDGSTVRVAPPAVAAVCDDLGAGDVFAAAFFVALARGAEPADAAAFGNAAAAVRLGGTGPGAIGDAAAIEAMLDQA